MNKELEALASNVTWVVTDLPKGKKAIGCKWVFKVKFTKDGTLERYKARLVLLKGSLRSLGLTMQKLSPML